MSSQITGPRRSPTSGAASMAAGQKDDELPTATGGAEHPSEILVAAREGPAELGLGRTLPTLPLDEQHAALDEDCEHTNESDHDERVHKTLLGFPACPTGGCSKQLMWRTHQEASSKSLVRQAHRDLQMSVSI